MSEWHNCIVHIKHCCSSEKDCYVGSDTVFNKTYNVKIVVERFRNEGDIIIKEEMRVDKSLDGGGVVQSVICKFRCELFVFF